MTVVPEVVPRASILRLISASYTREVSFSSSFSSPPSVISMRFLCPLFMLESFLKSFSSEVPFVRMNSGFKLSNAMLINLWSVVGGERSKGLEVKAMSSTLSVGLAFNSSAIVSLAKAYRLGCMSLACIE